MRAERRGGLTLAAPLHDPDLAEALLDRVLERGEHIRLSGKSWRTQKTDPSAFSDEP